MKTIEISQIDRRYEGLRIVDALQEKALLQSIVECGLKEPLGCVMDGDTVVLLDGFKRFRCCMRLKIGAVEVKFIGADEVSGVLRLLRLSQRRPLSVLEEAAFVDILHRHNGRSIIEIAEDIGRSPSWVSMRAGFLGQMSEYTRVRIFNGKFPVRSYLYSLRRFTRVKRVSLSDIDLFVGAICRKKFSTRDIELLARAYFHGDAKLKEQLCRNTVWTLSQFKRHGRCDPRGLYEHERSTLADLDALQKYSKRVVHRLKDTRHTNALFFTTASKLINDILGQLPRYQAALEEFYAFRGPKKSDTSVA